MSGSGTEQPRRSWLNRLWTNERGQGIIEYVLIISVVGLGSVLALGILSGKINDLFFSAGNALEEGTEGLVRPPSGTTGDFDIPNNCILVGGQTIDYTYYQANTVYGPGTAQNPQGYEGIYVSQVDAILLGLGAALCPGSANFPPTSFDIGQEGYDFDCFWSFATWHVPGNPSLVLGGRCAVAPTIPAGGTVSLAPTGPVLLGTTLTATTGGWSGNPETYRFTWQRTTASTSYATNGCPASGYSTYATTNNSSSPSDNESDLDSASEGNRCYRVTVRASNPAGNSVPPEPVSNSVLVQLPPPPAGGSVSIDEGATVPLNTTLHATTTGWSGNPTDYTFLWQQGTAGAPCASATFSGNWDTDTNQTPTDTLGNTPNSISEGNRCYQVSVTAINPGGSSTPPQPTARVFVQNPPPPSGGSVTITEGDTVAINTTLHATTSWSAGSPTSYTFLWQQGNAGAPCASATFSGTWDSDTNNTPDDTLGNTPNSASEGNRCYRVTVTATGLGGTSAPPQPTDRVFVTVPPPPTPGSVSISPTGPVADGSTLTATLAGWGGTIPGTTLYEFEWERTGSNTPTCAGSYFEFDTDQTTNTSDPYSPAAATRCYRVHVRGSNNGGSTWSAFTAYSNVVTVLNVPQPGSVSITGTNPQAAGTMTATTALSGWSNGPTSITFEWQRAAGASSCPSSGSSSWATFRTQTVTATSPNTTDSFGSAAGQCYRVRVRGTNAVGTGGNSSFSSSVRVT